MLLPKVRRAIAADASRMGALNVAASRRGYAGLVPDRILNAISCFFAPLTLTADVSGQFNDRQNGRIPI